MSEKEYLTAKLRTDILFIFVTDSERNSELKSNDVGEGNLRSTFCVIGWRREQVQGLYLVIIIVIMLFN